MHPLRNLLFAALLATPVAAAFAQTAIDQNRALAGSVTPGDAPGFPVTLSQPGSYKLTGNLTVPMGATAIVIAANGVTLDLNGFTVSGPSSCTRDQNSGAVSCSYQASDSVSIGIDASEARGTTVRNGKIQGFGGPGVRAGMGDHYEGLRLAENRWGLFSTAGGGGAGAGALVERCTLELNQLHGLYMFVGLVNHSRALHNGSSGFAGPGPRLTVADSQAIGNRVYGLTSVSARGSFTDTAVYSVTSMGGNLRNGTPF